jgi:hypothetical protein
MLCLNGGEYWTPDDFVQKANEIIAMKIYSLKFGGEFNELTCYWRCTWLL